MRATLAESTRVQAPHRRRYVAEAVHDCVSLFLCVFLGAAVGHGYLRSVLQAHRVLHVADYVGLVLVQPHLRQVYHRRPLRRRLLLLVRHVCLRLFVLRLFARRQILLKRALRVDLAPFTYLRHGLRSLLQQVDRPALVLCTRIQRSQG